MKDYLKQTITKLKLDPNYKEIKKKIAFSMKAHPEKFLYYYKVWELTNIDLHLVPDIEKRCFDFQLDHIIPISLGYKHGISPYIIGANTNLRMISKNENHSKGKHTTIDVKTALQSQGIVLLPAHNIVQEPPQILIVEDKKSLLYYSLE